MRLFFLIVAFSCTKLFAYPSVNVDTLIDFSHQDSLSLKKELIIMQRILSNDQFWSAILETDFYCTNQRILHAYRNRKSEYPKKRKDRHNYSNQEIYDLLWFGDDEIGSPKDGVLNFKLQVKIFEPNKNGTVTHGSTNRNTLIISSSPTTRINSPKQGVYACHLIHEYMHVLGFKHKHNTPSKNEKKCGGVDVPLRIQQLAKKFV